MGTELNSAIHISKGLYVTCAKSNVRKVGRDDAAELYHSAKFLADMFMPFLLNVISNSDF